MLFDLEYVEKCLIYLIYLDGKFGYKEFMWV